MPTKAGRPYQARGCPRVVRGDVSNCEEHARQVAREREGDRPSAARRGRDGNWRKLAEAANQYLEKGSQVFVEGQRRGDASKIVEPGRPVG